MRDLPTGLDLLELGRRLLLDDIAPLLPEARQRDIHLIATSIAIVAREAANADAPLRKMGELLRQFYPPRPDPLPASGESEHEELLRRFALDLRRGAFETSGSRERAARAILWRLTILKLGEGNPQFLAANGVK
ncbi:MAG TPA: hypothetical protein VND87_15085 [Stellaceae bacterium]|nr:hypothetical protein [Stellaceae bacterium]